MGLLSNLSPFDIPYKSGKHRDCMINAMGNAMHLLLRSERTEELFPNVNFYIAEASRRSLPYSQEKSEVQDLMKLGHLGLVFQRMLKITSEEPIERASASSLAQLSPPTKSEKDAPTR